MEVSGKVPRKSSRKPPKGTKDHIKKGKDMKLKNMMDKTGLAELTKFNSKNLSTQKSNKDNKE